MTRRINLISLCAISLVCILLLFASHRLTTTNYSTEYFRPGEYGRAAAGNSFRSIKSGGGHNSNGGNAIPGGGAGGAGGGASRNFNQGTIPTTINSSIHIVDVINSQRAKIAEEMENFEYPGGRFGVDAEKLSDLTMSTGGQPVRSIIITTWRSGSTFLGDILNAMPGNYYHYEPLLNFDIIQIRGPPHDQPAISNLKKLLKCDYSDLEDYLTYGQSHVYLFSHNTRLWRQCRQFCWDPSFLTPYCKLFPLQSMKVVRLRLALAEQLLNDTSLNVRIILLMRDPRGTLQSRKHRDWCPGRPDCDHPPTICKDMVADYYAAQILLEKYPQRFRAVRYEDLSLNPYEMTQDILQFYGLPFDPQVEEFLDSHTKSNYGGVSSTFRDSKSAPFHWIKDLDIDEILSIQRSCVKAMELWGYRTIASNDSTLDFDPLLAAPFS